MKVLEIKEKRAHLINPETNEVRSMKDVTEIDVLAIVQAIFDGQEVECDDAPTVENCPNEAERVIYAELKQQIDKLFKEKSLILADLDKKFADAESFYARSQPDSTFADWGLSE